MEAGINILKQIAKSKIEFFFEAERPDLWLRHV